MCRSQWMRLGVSEASAEAVSCLPLAIFENYSEEAGKSVAFDWPFNRVHHSLRVMTCCRLASKQELLDNAHATLSALHERYSALTQVIDFGIMLSFREVLPKCSMQLRTEHYSRCISDVQPLKSCC